MARWPVHVVVQLFTFAVFPIIALLLMVTVGRWLTADYRMGDVLMCTMRTVHAGTDNHTDGIRLSTDSRYQPAAAPVDERWVSGEHGEDPIGHGLAAKVGKIC